MRASRVLVALGLAAGAYLILRPRDAHLCAVLPLWLRAAETLGGRAVDPALYADNAMGFREYLDDVHAPDWSVGGVVPPRRFWPKTAALLLLAEQGGDALVLAAYRPGDATPLRDASGIVLEYPDEGQAEHAVRVFEALAEVESWLRVGARRRSTVVALQMLDGPDCCAL